MLSSRSMGKETVTGFKMSKLLSKNASMKGKFVDVFCGLGKLKVMQREPTYCTGLMCLGQLLMCKGRGLERNILAFLSTRRELPAWMQSFVIGQRSPCTQSPNNWMCEIQKHPLPPAGLRLSQRLP